MLDVRKISFGEADARNEIFQQKRVGSNVFMNSFVVPPSVDYEHLRTGAKFFITGPKGSGKTAMLWHLKTEFESAGLQTHITLFKSDVTEVDRQRLLTLSDVGGLSVVTDQKNVQLDFDFKRNWLWYIFRRFAEHTAVSSVIEGHEALSDLRLLSGIDRNTRSSITRLLQFSKIRASLAAGLRAGPFTSRLKLDLDDLRQRKEVDVGDVVDVSEQLLLSVRLKRDKPVILFFDELELFLNKEDQRDRDLLLIRDLLYAVSRLNRKSSEVGFHFRLYASVRSEILEEVNRLGPEIRRDIRDFGAHISWEAQASDLDHPLLKIIENKIHASELEIGMSESNDVWSVYFPESLNGRNFRQYLLDISMFRPRNIVSRLNFAKDKHAVSTYHFQSGDFERSNTDFSSEVWVEVEEDLAVDFNPDQRRSVRNLFVGYRKFFTLAAFRERVAVRAMTDPNIKTLFRADAQIDALIERLYRIGAIGNRFHAETSHRRSGRDRWSFRGYPEPLLDVPFVVHESLHKVFQL